MARIVDTSVLINMERRGRGPDALPEIMPAEEGLALAAVTVSELLLGAYRADSDVRRRRREIFLDAILEAIPVFPFGLREARTYGWLLAHLMARGQLIGAHDAQIAATALTQGYGVLSENVSDFQRVPGLSATAPLWP